MAVSPEGRRPSSHPVGLTHTRGMTDMITLTGLVATVPRHMVTAEGLPITSFRLASTQRRFDRAQERWVDGETNWYTITAFRQLAMNVSTSVQKGERVVATGRLRIREWATGDKTGTNIEVDADAVGHDLSWGTATFRRSISNSVADAPAVAQADELAAEGASPVDGSAPEDAEVEQDSLESVAAPF